MLLAPVKQIVLTVALSSVFCLVVLGWLSAKIGGAPILPAMARVAFWGIAAMAITAGAGRLVGVGL